MKRLVGLLVIFVFAAQYASAVSMRRRREADASGKDTGVVDSLMSLISGAAGMVKSLPIVGGWITWGQTWIGDTASAVADFDNGMVARIMGGTLPCEIDIDTGITCTGVTNRTNVAHLILALLDQSPLPNFVKRLSYSALSTFLEPILNALFGGVPVPSM